MVSTELDHWLEKIQRFHSSEIELGLSRLEKVASKLELTPNAFVITVAGTNGKGSTINCLDKIFAAHNLTTGVYSSPHFIRFNERICMSQQEVSDAALIQAFEQIDSVRGEIPLTFFEYTTLAAFLLFKQANLDVWILEVGLGGRLDAVNIIDADIAVITSIGLDHQEYLGDTRELIGFEKAGIFRADKPAVIGDIDCPDSIKKHAEELGAKALYRYSDFDLKSRSERHFQWQGKAVDETEVDIEFTLSSQMITHNAATVLQTIYAWKSDWNQGKVAQVLADFSMQGRNQSFEYKTRQFILDVAHNSHAAKAFLDNIAVNKEQSFSLVLGMLDDKDYQNVIALLVPFVDSWRVVDLPTERNLGKESLKRCILDEDGSAKVVGFDSVQVALEDVLDSDGNQPVLILGSFYTVAEALRFFNQP